MSDQLSIIRMAKEAGFKTALIKGQIFTTFPLSNVTKEIERFAELVRADEREVCSRVRAAKPQKLKPVGSGALLGEQQYCFDKGYKEGAASVRAAIRARGQA